MKTEKFEGSIESYQGKTLDKPIAYSGSVENFENVAEAKASEDWPGDSEILKVVNTKRLTAAKAAIYQKETADLKKAYEASPEFKTENLIKSILAASPNKTRAEAQALAESLMA